MDTVNEKASDISRYLINDAELSEKSLRFDTFYAKIHDYSYKPHMVRNYSLLATFLSLTILLTPVFI